MRRDDAEETLERKMTDDEFLDLQWVIQKTFDHLQRLQDKYKKVTGRFFVSGQKIKIIRSSETVKEQQ